MPQDMSYTVLSKEERTVLDENMKPVTLFRIWARSKGGTRFHIEVSEGDLASAPKLLEARAKQLDSL